MAGRNHETRLLLLLQQHKHQHPIPPPEIHLIQDRISTQNRDIKTLLLDNQRLASTHVSLKQDVTEAERQVRQLSATAISVKAERDAQVRQVYERSLKLKVDAARSIEVLSAELLRVRDDVKELKVEREELLNKLTVIDDGLARNRLELRGLNHIKAEIDALRKDIKRGRAALDFERKLHTTNFIISEKMEGRIIFMAGEANKLRSELANPGTRAIEAANSGHEYVAENTILEPGFGENSVSNNLYAVDQESQEIDQDVTSTSRMPDDTD